MSHRLKKPKAYLFHGNPAARLRKQVQKTITTQAALDRMLAALPKQMRAMALEQMHPHLSFEPAGIVEETP